ncbi:MAG: hypothetical protein IAG10_33035 [Planctomycetaceae bacterium]|nr:hypothetical protein [Planctomycetaceae bacterium]
MEALSSHPRLAKLSLHEPKAPERVLEQCVGWKNLTTVYLSYGPGSPSASLKSLVALPNLRHIHLVARLTDDDLLLLSKLESIESVRLTIFPWITDAGWQQLQRLPHLNKLIIHDRSQNPELADQLRELLPKCTIEWK